ncbi:unnamed protein product, partial [Amoebophrya sp. A25]
VSTNATAKHSRWVLTKVANDEEAAAREILREELGTSCGTADIKDVATDCEQPQLMRKVRELLEEETRTFDCLPFLSIEELALFGLPNARLDGTRLKDENGNPIDATGAPILSTSIDEDIDHGPRQVLIADMTPDAKKKRKSRCLQWVFRGA